MLVVAVLMGVVLARRVVIVKQLRQREVDRRREDEVLHQHQHQQLSLS